MFLLVKTASAGFNFIELEKGGHTYDGAYAIQFYLKFKLNFEFLKTRAISKKNMPVRAFSRSSLCLCN